ncbi:MAG: S-adenosylmethionine:tRNA ribosyltransferase-isomerase, partial [Clostridia bacterium]|nr:S-adenosylmethionine:tRNA ribosyltransferase-isomerase [Clostridia bacterium]
MATDLTTHDFYYDLPEELIAQTPAERRDASRLMVLDRASGALTHRHFYDILDHVRPEDVLVVNSSRVIPARLLGEGKSGAPVELLLLRMREGGRWETLVRPGKRAREGAELSFGGILKARITEVLEDGNRLVEFSYPDAYKSIYEVLDAVGQMPLPPYITKKLEDKSRYQTV